MNPEEAAQSLATIRRTQAKALRSEPWFPHWYTTGVGVFVTGGQFVTEPGTPIPVMIGGGLVLLTGMVILAFLMVRRRKMSAHRSLMTGSGSVAFAVWLVGSIALDIALTFWLTFAEVPYGRTYGALAMTVFMAATGPFVARWISDRMARRVESGR
ncbi:hypothetical protein ACQPZZ_34570 [Microbispora sp. CA-135349]|uniref:hypothetical protein n=1 Tax=Microbispora sp. CA-135349 TaxID=3239953 RepID=UPI003D8F4C4F